LWELKNKRIEVEKHEVSLALINYNEEQERKFWEKYDKLMNKNNT
jgi:hypothetical protein